MHLILKNSTSLSKFPNSNFRWKVTAIHNYFNILFGFFPMTHHTTFIFASYPLSHATKYISTHTCYKCSLQYFTSPMRSFFENLSQSYTWKSNVILNFEHKIELFLLMLMDSKIGDSLFKNKMSWHRHCDQKPP